MSNDYVIPFEDKLKCSICQERIKDARSLPCGHTYCKDCIATAVRLSLTRGNYKCPECLKSAPLPSGGAEALPRCYTLNQLVGDINETFRSGGRVSISPHGFQAQETFACPICLELMANARYLPCGHSYCEQCLVNHPRSAPGRITCGKCQKEHSLASGGVGGLPVCYRINSIVAELKGNEKGAKTTLPSSSRSQPNGHAVPVNGRQRPPHRTTTVMEDVDEAKKRAQAQAKQIQVFVKKIDGKTITVDINVNDNIDSLKRKIEAKVAVAPAQQTLTCNGKNLDQGSRTLQFYGIVNHSTIQLCARLRGGLTR